MTLYMQSKENNPLHVWQTVSESPPELCDHVRTVCRECIDGWAEDFRIRNRAPE